MSDLGTFIATCLTAVGGALLISAQPTVPVPKLQQSTERNATLKPKVLSPSSQRAGRLYVTAIINGHDVELMIDTGASHTILSRSDANRLSLTGFRDIQVETLGGRAVMREAHAGSVTLQGGTIAVGSVLISETSDQSLLGMDLIMQLGGTHLALQPQHEASGL